MFLFIVLCERLCYFIRTARTDSRTEHQRLRPEMLIAHRGRWLTAPCSDTRSETYSVAGQMNNDHGSQRMNHSSLKETQYVTYTSCFVLPSGTHDGRHVGRRSSQIGHRIIIVSNSLQTNHLYIPLLKFRVHIRSPLLVSCKFSRSICITAVIFIILHRLHQFHVTFVSTVIASSEPCSSKTSYSDESQRYT